jgi:hypothetical protein
MGDKLKRHDTQKHTLTPTLRLQRRVRIIKSIINLHQVTADYEKDYINAVNDRRALNWV